MAWTEITEPEEFKESVKSDTHEKPEDGMHLVMEHLCKIEKMLVTLIESRQGEPEKEPDEPETVIAYHERNR